MKNGMMILPHEHHPVASGMYSEPTDGGSMVIFFGLHKSRGDDAVWSSRVTDNFCDVLEKNGLKRITEEPNIKGSPLDAKSALVEKTGTKCELVGIAYSIRNRMPGSKYLALLEQITESL